MSGVSSWVVPGLETVNSKLGTPSAQRRVLLGAGLVVAMGLAYLRWGAGAAGLGALACAAACVWAAWRAGEDRPVWLALAGACAGWALGGAAGAASGSSSGIGGLSFGDVGAFAFATAGAAAHLAWPEIRQAAPRLAAALLDAVTVAAGTALWGVAGFPPLGPGASPVLSAALARSGDALLPAVTAALAIPLVAATRRTPAIALAVGMGALLAADALGNREVVRLANQTGFASLLQAAGFAAIFWAALGVEEGSPEGEVVEPGRAQPPFLIPGLVGIGALALSAGALASGNALAVLFSGILALALGAREVLRTVVQRHTHQQLAASLELETRLLDLQGDTSPNLPAQEALQRSCSLAAEVLNADCALAWMAEPGALVLQAVGPAETLATFIGRRIPLDQAHSLLTRAFRGKAPEAWDAQTLADPLDRSIATALDAGWVLAAPIVHQNTAIGVLEVIRRPGTSPFDSFDQQRAALIGAQVASTLHRIELYDDLEYQLRESTLVHRFAVQAATAQSANDVAWYLLESVRARFPFDRGSVHLSEGASLKTIANFHARVPEGDTPPSVKPFHLSIALRCGDVLLGHVQLQRSGAIEAFTEDEMRVAQTLAQQAGFAIQRLRLEEESGKVSVYRELNRLKTDLLNAVSHDLRGPLGNIKSYAAALANEESELPVRERREYLETIEEEADHLRDLLDHLLDLSKIEAGMLHLDLAPVGVERLLRRILSSHGRSTHRYETNVAADLYVQGDGRRLGQVVYNLLDNAVKYSPGGGLIQLTAGATDSEVVISVADQGVGVPRHQWDRIFRPYQRADTAISHGIGGNGLGLAICKGIVEAHGGRIWVESAPGVGSTFSFTVPRAFVDEVRGQRDEARGQSHHSSLIPRPSSLV